MLMAMEMTLAREKRGCVWGGHMLGCWGTDRHSLLPGLSRGRTGEPGAGDGAEGKVGLLATRVRGEWTPTGLGAPGEPG